MTIGEVINMLKEIFAFLSEYLGKLFAKNEEGDATEEETPAV